MLKDRIQNRDTKNKTLTSERSEKGIKTDRKRKKLRV